MIGSNEKSRLIAAYMDSGSARTAVVKSVVGLGVIILITVVAAASPDPEDTRAWKAGEHVRYDQAA